MERKAAYNVLGGLVVLAIVLAGCGPSASPAVPTGAAQVQTEVATGQPTAQPKSQIVFALSTDVDVLDPQLFKNDTAYIVEAALYGALFQESYTSDSGALNATGGFQSNIFVYPPKYSDDRKTVTLKLNPDAKWQDGSPITSADWYYTWDRIFNGPGYISLLLPIIGIASIESVEAPDPQTLVIHRDFDSPMFEPFMASPCCFVVMNSKVAGEHATSDDPWAAKWFTQNPFSSGPYMLESWTPGQEIALAPNPYYASSGLVGNSGIIFKVVPSPEDRVALLTGGAIDVALDIPLKDVKSLETENKVHIYHFPGRRFHYVGFNLNLAPFDDVNLRKAVQMAIPYDDIIANVTYGYAQKIGSVVSVGMPGYKEVLHPVQDLEGARTALAASSYHGEELKLTVRQSQPLDQQAAILIQDALRQVGVNVQIEILADVAFQEALGKKQIPMFLMDWQSLGNDGFYQLTWVAKSDSPINYTGYANEQVDALIAQGVPEGDPAQRADLLEQAQTIWAESVPMAPLFQPDNVVLTGSNISGVNNFYDPLRRVEFLAKTEQ